MSHNLETRSLMGEIRRFDKCCFFDFGHPLLNRIAESFVKAAGIGAIQAVSREAYFTAIEVKWWCAPGDLISVDGKKRQRAPDLRGETNRKSLEALLGLAAGVYSGLTYGLSEARGVHDWVIRPFRDKPIPLGSSLSLDYFWYSILRISLEIGAVAGAITGVALALTTADISHEQIVQCAITGAAISTAANLLTGIF
ncbi:hypothetical protein H0E87_015953 [Populus deltoides]|uniref:Uncharacterized protein n=1 Tax=Populus deltoides TaxID=3696 RepID=A0A8T2Y762_POPDE|nr:hypothetical protein H0E87_015953 [Populus deltoides]